MKNYFKYQLKALVYFLVHLAFVNNDLMSHSVIFCIVTRIINSNDLSKIKIHLIKVSSCSHQRKWNLA